MRRWFAAWNEANQRAREAYYGEAGGGLCPKGLHPMTGDNVRLTSDGHERCRDCFRAWRREHEATHQRKHRKQA